VVTYPGEFILRWRINRTPSGSGFCLWAALPLAYSSFVENIGGLPNPG